MTKADSSASISSLSLSPCNLNPTKQKLPPALKVPETKTCRLRVLKERIALCKILSLTLFLPPTFDQHWRQEIGLAGPTLPTAKTVRDVLDQTYMKGEKSVAQLCFTNCLRLFNQARTAKVAKWTMTLLFESPPETPCSEGRLREIQNHLLHIHTRRDCLLQNQITQKTYPLLDVLHKGNDTSWHEVFPAHWEKATHELLSESCQFFGFSEAWFL